MEALDGFLTALVVCPDLIMPSEYLPIILTGRTEDDDLVFESVEEARRFHDVLARHWNEISRAFHDGEIPVLRIAHKGDEFVGGGAWANGFLTGTLLRHGMWKDIANDEERGGPFIPIWALAYEHDVDPSMRPYEHPISPELREKLIVGVVAGLRQLYVMFREDRKARDTENPFSHSSRFKAGRNDPCPCGSGKKFKACCGQRAFH